MSIESDLAELEINIENVKGAIKLAETLEKLEENPEWKELITEGFLKKEAARVVALKGDMQMRMAGEIQMQWLEDMITGIGAFQAYLNFIRQRGASARQTLAQNEETREHLLQEQLEGAE